MTVQNWQPNLASSEKEFCQWDCLRGNLYIKPCESKMEIQSCDVALGACRRCLNAGTMNILKQILYTEVML